MTLRPPTSAPSTIGPYRVEREIARGGMGIVYLARDTRLDRAVAIKALPDDVASDPERLSRFEREAKLVASLNHPNIAGIHGIEESEGRRYLALEHVEGETLAERLSRGPLPVGEAVEICLQIASGIEAAHEAGVIHRDLKPGNVLVTPGDQVKIVDFGLAKGKVAPESGLGDSPASSPFAMQSPTIPQSPTIVNSPTLAHSPTFGSPATMPGVILGTAGYLSPEQARGKPVDRRTDIWSFGCVLYECLTGRLAFPGETVSDTIAKILEREVDWSALPASTPPAVRDLLHRCLEKDPRKRLRDIGDARLTLEEVKAGGIAKASVAPAAPLPLSPEPRHWIFLAAVAGLIIGIGAGVFLGRGRREAEPVTRLSVVLPPDLRQTQVGQLTEDGRAFLLQALPRESKEGEEPTARIYVRDLDEISFRPLAGTERSQGFVTSPDSRWIAFVAPVSERSADVRLLKMPLDGSAPPVPVAKGSDDWQGSVVWLESGEFLVAVDDGRKVLRLKSDGTPAGAAKPLAAPGYEGTFTLARGLPKDRGVLLQGTSYAEGAYHVDIGVLDLESGKVRILVRDAGNPVYASTGHLLYSRGDALFAVPFDVDKLETRGTPTAIEGGLRIAQSWANASFGLSRNGTLRYVSGGNVSKDRRAVIVDTQGHVTEWSGERQPFESAFAASPDGERFASVIANEGAIYEIWVSERGHSASQRVVARPGIDCGGPTFSPDGTKLAYSQVSRSATDGIWIVDANGGGEPHRVAKGSAEVTLNSTAWSPDGRWILAIRSQAGRPDVVVIPAEGSDGTPTPLLPPGARSVFAAFSPDGRMIAFLSDQTGKFELYVAAWDGQRLQGQPLLVSTGGIGSYPMWSKQGRLYIANTLRTRLMAVTIAREPRLAASPPVASWNLEPLRVASSPGAMMAMLPGDRLLVIQKGANEDDVSRYELALHFDDVIRAKTHRR